MSAVIPLSDFQREALIASCQTSLEVIKDPIAAAEVLELMKGLINGRSPEQIARMERARGLS
jgi:hypothetical protein